MTQNQKTIFVIDDDLDLVELISYNLQKEGYKTRKAFSGLQSIWEMELQNERPDCILLDLMMPSPNGFEICDYLKSSEDYRDIPLAIVSACSSPEDIQKALDLGADAYLPKPFSIDQLKAMVKSLSSRHLGQTREVENAHSILPLFP